MKLERYQDKAPAFKFYIRHVGVWDMQDLYETMIGWFRQRKYKFYEKIYKHKHPSPFGLERQYVWTAERETEDYVKFIVDIYYHTYDAHEIEVTMKDGSKKIFTKGRLWMEFDGEVLFDWEKRFSKNSFYAHLQNFYFKYVAKDVVTGYYWDMMRYKTLGNLKEAVSVRLKLQTQGFEMRYFTGVHT